MIKKGIVVAADGIMATIEELSESCCLDCIDSGKNNNCLTCKNRSQGCAERHISVNTVEAQVGDIVEFSKNKFENVISSLMIFAVPIILMVITYIVLNLITSNDQLSGRVSIGILVISMICSGAYSYKLSKSRCDYKIISKL